MKLASFVVNGGENFGIVTNEGILPVKEGLKALLPDLKTLFGKGQIEKHISEIV